MYLIFVGVHAETKPGSFGHPNLFLENPGADPEFWSGGPVEF